MNINNNKDVWLLMFVDYLNQTCYLRCGSVVQTMHTQDFLETFFEVN